MNGWMHFARRKRKTTAAEIGLPVRGESAVREDGGLKEEKETRSKHKEQGKRRRNMRVKCQ